jgi:hypothetical protein
MACFRKFGPDLECGSMPFYAGTGMEGKPSVQEAVFIIQEYVKAVLNSVRHGVWVWGGL